MKWSILSLLLILSSFASHAQDSTIHAFSFDFDDTIMHTIANIYLYNTKTGTEIAMSTESMAEVKLQLGQPGPYQDYALLREKDKNSFRDFQGDEDNNKFLDQMVETLKTRDPSQWKGPRWENFVEALSDPESARWVSIITAREIDADLFYDGLLYLHAKGYVKYMPRRQFIFTVNSSQWRRRKLSTEQAKTVAMQKVLDRLEKEGKPATFEFMDDDYTNFSKALDFLTQSKNRWPHVEVKVSYVGRRHPNTQAYTVNLGSAFLLAAPLCRSVLK